MPNFCRGRAAGARSQQIPQRVHSRDPGARLWSPVTLDDVVRYLLAGSYREQRASLNLLKYLANDLHISIVAVGTDDAPVALQTDSQISSRFTPLALPRWSECDEFQALLGAFALAKARNMDKLLSYISEHRTTLFEWDAHRPFAR